MVHAGLEDSYTETRDVDLLPPKPSRAATGWLDGVVARKHGQSKADNDYHHEQADNEESGWAGRHKPASVVRQAISYSHGHCERVESKWRNTKHMFTLLSPSSHWEYAWKRGSAQVDDVQGGNYCFPLLPAFCRRLATKRLDLNVHFPSMQSFSKGIN